jgi:hypothetical protein
MRSPASGSLRALRAGLVALVCVSFALAGHVMSGGARPSMVGLAAVSFITFAAMLSFTRRERSFGAYFRALLAGQVAFHASFMLGAQHGATAAGSHSHHASAELTAQAGSSLLVSPAMAAGHVLAALLAAALLAFGERAVWAAYRVVAFLLTPFLEPAVDYPSSSPRARAQRSSGKAIGLLIARSRGRRGPPALLAA